MFRRLTTVLFAIVFIALNASPSYARSAISACATLARQVQALPPGPVFLASFPTVKEGPLAGVAYLYDNALAVLALTGCGDRTDAQRIGDAILAATARDRAWHDGRLRNGYAAGPVTDGPVKLPGWWDKQQNRWLEDRYVVGSDTGNLAWALLALASLSRADPGDRYRKAAERLGAWLGARFDIRRPSGFAGGTFGHEPDPAPVTWKSTEQNADLAAAFARLAEISSDREWRARSSAAEHFVERMYVRSCGCFAAGTAEDAVTVNRTLALDAQLVPFLATRSSSPHFRKAIATANARLSFAGGYSYGEARNGIWTEGTAQAALLMALAGEHARAAQLEAVLATLRLPDGEYYAASAGALPTGFGLATDPSAPRVYFRIAHLAALAWVALLERRFNPYVFASTLP